MYYGCNPPGLTDSGGTKSAIGIYKPPDVRPILEAYHGKNIPLEYAKKEAETKQRHIEEWRSGKKALGIGGVTMSSLFGHHSSGDVRFFLFGVGVSTPDSDVLDFLSPVVVRAPHVSGTKEERGAEAISRGPGVSPGSQGGV